MAPGKDVARPAVVTGSPFRGPNRLWSLWDMQQLYLTDLLNLAKELGRLTSHYETLGKDHVFTEDVKNDNKASLGGYAETFGELGLQMCRLKCETLIEAMGKDFSATELSAMFNELAERMKDEAKLRVFLALDVSQADFAFPRKPLFGEETDKKFPAAAFEIDEAGKCLGLSRPTAAVFHLMRVLEIGIAATARCLSISDPIKPAQRNWGAILKTIKDELDRRAAAKLPAPWANPDKAFFEEIYASLDAVRNPWRNATMHVENKYIEEEAEHIFIAVRAFMRKLASRMDENGEPKVP